jgi:hypothetical protein
VKEAEAPPVECLRGLVPNKRLPKSFKENLKRYNLTTGCNKGTASMTKGIALYSDIRVQTVIVAIKNKKSFRSDQSQTMHATFGT